ncbi:MAG: radical SAM protein [Candidatus Heimdallarchaeaceae archaeon]
MFSNNHYRNTTQICDVCGEQKQISQILSICNSCLRNNSKATEEYIFKAHKKAREKQNLPPLPPSNLSSICNLCNHKCGLDKNGISYCGLKYNKEGKVISLTNSNIGILDYYLDPLPCNCCAAWFCPAGTGSGFPEFAMREGKEYGFYNLSIFFYGCSFDCLYCQNQHHKNIRLGPKENLNKLLDTFRTNKKITCICFFGGSPEPHFPFALNLSKKVLQVSKEEKRIVRICWEWNGFGNQRYISKAAEFSLISGGNIKFDLKAWNPQIHKALTGVTNEKVLENFKFVAKNFFEQRPELPVLNATTLLVPGYIDEEEVENIASFIADLNENIPYSLLAFYPQHMFKDLPVTSRELAESCENVAKKHLKMVNIGNKHLLI